MPKIKPSCSYRLHGFVSEFGNDTFSTDGLILFCNYCGTRVSSDRRFTVEQHLKTAKHVRSATSKKKIKIHSPQLVSFITASNKSPFYTDMCRAFLAANIPLNSVSNTVFRNFLTKYTGKEIPDEFTLCNNYLTDCYEETLMHIRNEVFGNKIWVSIDETTDSEGRYVANVIIGILEKDRFGKIFLLNSEELEKVNFSTISKLFDKSMFLLWPKGIHHDDVLLFVTDDIPYMVKAANSMKALYSKMVHVTCLVQAHHQVAEIIHEKYDKLDKLVINIKEMFLKSPSHVEIFKNESPNIPIPPTPLAAYPGTWVEAAIYYADNLKCIQNVVNKLKKDETLFISNNMKILFEPTLESDLVYIQSNFRCLPININKLESPGKLLSKAIEIVNDTKEALKVASDKAGKEIFNKFESFLEKNTGYKTLIHISKILSEDLKVIEGIEEDLSIEDVAFFKYAPITSFDVKDCFPNYKNLFTNNRHNFNFESLKQTIVIQCNITD